LGKKSFYQDLSSPYVPATPDACERQEVGTTIAASEEAAVALFDNLSVELDALPAAVPAETRALIKTAVERHAFWSVERSSELFKKPNFSRLGFRVTANKVQPLKLPVEPRGLA
jgi:hypothetical protein